MKNRGYTLTEMLLTLGAALMIAIVTFISSQIVNQSASAKALSETALELTLAIEDSMGRVQSYSGLSSQELIDRDLAFPLLEDTGGRLYSAWGEVTFASHGAARDGFSITFSGVPERECMPFINYLSAEFMQIQVNGRLVSQEGQVNQAIAGEACAGNSVVRLTRYTPGLGQKALFEEWT